MLHPLQYTSSYTSKLILIYILNNNNIILVNGIFQKSNQLGPIWINLNYKSVSYTVLFPYYKWLRLDKIGVGKLYEWVWDIFFIFYFITLCINMCIDRLNDYWISYQSTDSAMHRKVFGPHFLNFELRLPHSLAEN